MIFTLLAWVYITVVCRLWGELTLAFIRKLSGNREIAPLHFSIYCFLGLAGISVCFTILSLFMPLGGWEAQLIVLLPCLAFITRKSFVSSFFPRRDFCSVPFLLLFIFCAILILIMSSWYITNQDTLGYHAQVIQWIEKYRAVPGIVHLHVRYGLQSSWLVDSALFSFRFTGTPALGFLNSTILTWFVVFVINRANNYSIAEKGKLKSFLWLALLLCSLLSYTQIRLTATSGSPDFTGALYTWLVFYLLLRKKSHEQSTTDLVLLLTMGLFAFTIKLSAVPAALVSVYAGWRLLMLGKGKILVTALVPAFLVVLPFAARNIISSGYVLFPSTFPDIANVDWKTNDDVVIWAKYVTTYARVKSEATTESIHAALALKPSQWLPIWWKNQSRADQGILVLVALSLLLVLARLRKIINSDHTIFVALLVAIAGSLFWFIKAPDPRFGFGFLVPLIGIAGLVYIPITHQPELPVKKIVVGLVFTTIACIGGYTVYRVKNFFTVSQLLSPKGIMNEQYRIISCNGVNLNIPAVEYGCGDISIPCTYDSCRTFQPRGKDIIDGFRLSGSR